MISPQARLASFMKSAAVTSAGEGILALVDGHLINKTHRNQPRITSQVALWSQTCDLGSTMNTTDCQLDVY